VMTSLTGTVGYDADFYPFGGERNPYTNTISQHFKFEGKERDSETNNDDFGARYYSSAFGRWLSPDWSAVPVPVPYANPANPQTLNLYSMVRNNPDSYADSDGHYVFNASGCGDDSKCQKKWDRAESQFEKRREKNLNSKKADVRDAAAAYGAPGDANGVYVGFANLASHGVSGSVGASGSANGSPLVQVTLDFGRAGSSETITHEGTHVADDMKFLSSFNAVTGGYDQALNVTHGQTEHNAFKAGAEINHEHGFGPNDDQKIWNFLRASPVYGPVLNVPVFDPTRFPSGTSAPTMPPQGGTDN
jgi:RHS repeat-associated protein